ncbi:MAG TPA: tryptophan--tRNA ligase, partial [Chloroflexota bacterium]
FVQSHVPEHTTLCWLLDTITPMGWLNRMTQFKSKAGSERESVGAGLYVYPVLMAADILLYRTNFVPVGEDQKQHVELTRDIAERFNGLFGETFVVPEPLIPTIGARIMSLDDPSRKMSKSEPGGAIFLLDSPDVVRRKVSRAVTDSIGAVRFSPDQPGLLNLLSMYEILSGHSPAEIEAHFDGQGYSAVKGEVADLISDALTPVQRRYRELEQSPEVVDEVLAHGADRAHELASRVARNAAEKMGLLQLANMNERSRLTV